MVKHISILLLGIIFLISSSGYMVYKTNCSCTGVEQTSIFVRPGTCEDNFHKHHIHNKTNNEIACSSHECHDCADHTKSCGCDTPEFFYFKLKDKAVDEDVNFVQVQSIELFVASAEILAELNADGIDLTEQNFNSDPPPIISTSLDFLIQIHQLKIPSLT